MAEVLPVLAGGQSVAVDAEEGVAVGVGDLDAAGDGVTDRDEHEAVLRRAIEIEKSDDHELVAVLVVALAEERDADALVEMMAPRADRDPEVLEMDPLVPPQSHRGRLKAHAAGRAADMDELTKRRLKHNEELFREVNEAREAASQAADPQELDFVCECADPECTARIRTTVAEFERIRQSPELYIVLPGHVVPAIERIVEERGAFEVVEKDAA
jgi:hypothetical protein